VIFSLGSVPSLNIVVHFTEADSAKTEPKNHAARWEEVFGRDLKRVHDKEAI
jgi:hypothetical protein